MIAIAARFCLGILLAVTVLAAPASAQSLAERGARIARQMAGTNDLNRRLVELNSMIRTGNLRIDEAQDGLIGWDEAIAAAEVLHDEARPALEALIRVARTLTFERGTPGYDALFDQTEDYLYRALPADLQTALDLLARDIDAARRRDTAALETIDLELQRLTIRMIEQWNLLLRTRQSLLEHGTSEYFLGRARIEANTGFVAAIEAGFDPNERVIVRLRAAARSVRMAANGLDDTRDRQMDGIRYMAVRGDLQLTEPDLAALEASYVAAAAIEREIAGVLDRIADLTDPGFTDPALKTTNFEALTAQLQEIAVRRQRAAGERAQIIAKGMP